MNKNFQYDCIVTLHGLTAMASVLSELRRPLRGVGTPIPAPTVNVGTGVGVIGAGSASFIFREGRDLAALSGVI